MRLILPGNCFFWSLILWCIYGGKIFTINQVSKSGIKFKHYMLRDRNGKIRHFKRKYDFLPEPLCLILFLGTIERSGKRKKSR